MSATFKNFIQDMHEVYKRDFLGTKSCFSFYLAFLLLQGLSAEGHTDKTILYPNGIGVITSPGYPKNYPDNANYIWILNTGSQNATVTFSILDFEIPKPYFQPCDDYLKIEETDPCCFTVLKRCDRGEFKPFNRTATGNKITISFVSDDKNNAKGFNLTWKVNLPETITTSTTSTSSPPPPTTTLTTTTSSPPPTTTTTTILTTTATTAITKTNETERSPLITDTSCTTQQWTKSHNDSEQNNTTGRADDTGLKPPEIVSLILGISAIEIALIAIGVYIVRKRRSSSREKKNQDVNFDKKVQPVSRESAQSIHSIGNFYESIPLEHFSTDVIAEDDGNENQDENKMYADIPDHVYDRTFKHRPYLNQQPNLYNMISELKLKRL